MKRKAPFGLFIKENEKAEEMKPSFVKKGRKAKRLSDRQILKKLSKLLGVSENDLPKTLERFKKEIDEIKE